jgi:hypothetical protein
MLASPAPAQTYRNEQKHFSIELPKEWVVMPQSELDQINARLGGGVLGGVRYEGGLRKKGARLGAYPYVLIQCQAGPPSGASYADIEKSLAIDMKAPIKEVKGRLGDLAKDLQIGQPVLSRESNCVILRTQITVPGIGDVKGFSVGHLGKSNSVFVHCYALDKDFDAAMPVFRRINDWFSFDKGYDFKPGAGGTIGFSWSSVGRSAVVGGIVGLLVVGGGFLFRSLSRSNRGRRPASTDVDELV